MGRLKVLKTSPLATVQDHGRFGFRKYGIPQSGAMDKTSMDLANSSVGNSENAPVIEFALLGMKFLVEENTMVAVSGAEMKINGKIASRKTVKLMEGDELELLPPEQVYAYLAIAGTLNAKNDFDSFSTYLMGKFGGFEGRALKVNDVLETTVSSELVGIDIRQKEINEPNVIRFIEGPESYSLLEPLNGKSFTIDPSSNRMGIRLNGSIESNLDEIVSSAVVPGVIQLPPGGQPIVLMNDCQTTGGYPRIGTVTQEDLGKLAQIRPGKQVSFVLS